MRLDTCAVELRRFVAQDVARQEHACRLAADAARTDLAVFDVQQVAHGEVFPAQGKARRLVAEQAAEHVLLEAFSVGIRRLVPVGDGVKHAVPAVAPLPRLGEALKDGIVIRTGGQGAPLRAGDLQRKIRRLRAAAAHLDGMDIDTAVERADVGEQRRLAADARHGLVGVLFIIDRLIRDRLTPDEKRVDQQEKVRDHQVGKPIFLQLRQAVEHEKRAERLLVNDAVHLHGKGLKAHARIKLVFLDICAALAQRRRIHDLPVISKAYVDDAVALAGNIGHESRCDVHIVADMFTLPDDRVARTKVIDRLIEAVDAGGNAALSLHSLLLAFTIFYKGIPRCAAVRRNWWYKIVYHRSSAFSTMLISRQAPRKTGRTRFLFPRPCCYDILLLPYCRAGAALHRQCSPSAKIDEERKS